MLPARPLRHALQQALKAALTIVAIAVFIAVALLASGLLSSNFVPGPGERVRLDLRSLRSAVRLHVRQYGRPPPNEGWVEALVRMHALEQQPLDPWGNPYTYEVQGEHVELRSLGRDGAPGGDGADQDTALSFTVTAAPTDAGSR